MQVRYGLLNLLRAWRKSLAFFLLLTVLTGTLCLGLGVYETGAAFLERCRESYTTIARFEYVGGDGENGDFLPGAYEAAQALTLPSDSTLLWDPAHRMAGRLEGVVREDQKAPSAQACVLVVKPSGYDADRNLYSAYVVECLYSHRDRTGQLVYIDGQDISMETGRYYLLHGSYFVGFSAISNVAVETPTNRPELSDKAMLVDVTTAGGYDYSAYDYLLTLADYHRELSSFLPMTATADLAALYPFQQNQMTISQGRGFTAGDGQVVVLSEILAESMGWQVGDKVILSLSAQAGQGIYESYWPTEGFDHVGEYTIVGLFAATAEKRFEVFLPSDAVPVLAEAQSGRILGQATVDNEKAETFYAQVREGLPSGVQVTMLDQGYAAVAAPFAHMLQATGLVLLACILADLAVLALFGYLFVYRQGNVVKNMHRLGAGQGAAAVYFLSGAGFLACLAALAGFGLALALSGQAEQLVLRLLTGAEGWDLRYSISRLGVSKTLDYTPQVAVWVLALGAVFQWLGAMLVTLVFVRHGHGRNKKRKVRSHRGPSRSLRGGSWKFAWLSAVRGGGRSCSPVVVLLCAVLLLGFLPHGVQNDREQRAALERDTEILGYFTNSDAQFTDGLSLPADNFRGVYQSPLASDFTVTYSCRYGYRGYVDQAGAYVGESLELPESSFAMEVLLKKLLGGPQLVITNALPLAPEFQYAAGWEMRWLEGYDETSLELRPIEKGTTVFRAVAPEEFLEEHDLELGDTAVLQCNTGSGQVETFYLQLIGAYTLPDQQGNIYAEISLYFGDQYAELEPYLGQMLNRLHFRSAAFRVRAADLDAMRRELKDLGYSQVGSYDADRRWVVLDDQVYLDTAQALDRRLSYMDALFPTIYVLTELLALAASYVLTMNHKKDLAVMRSQGASRGTGFWSLFLSQLLLCLLGAGIGCGILAVTRTWTVLGAILIGIFLLLWLLGSGISILNMNRREIVKMIKSAE